MSTSDATTSSSTNNSFKTPRTRIETLNALQYIPLCPEEKKPKGGQVFETLESAELFYKEYCTICGFTPRLPTTKRIKGNELPNSFALRNVVCNRQGVKESRKRKRTDTDTDTAENDVESDVTDISRVRPITRIDCRALVQFKYQENGTYIVTRFDEAHNHPLASPESTIFLKGNRKMTEVQKQFVTKVKVLKLGGVKAYRGWKELCGGYDNIGATEVDFKNIVRDIKTYIDPICIKNYMLFGEVLSADATYGTNKYDMVFVPFTGVDHHKRCITFGAGLIGDEYLYDLREQWIPAYFKDVSMSGLMRVTSRSESENSFFDRFLTPHLTLVEFWVCYESALEAQRHKQSKLNSDNKHSEIPRKTKSNPEVHASEMHCLWILHNQDFQKILEQYITQRWTKAAMTKPVFDKDGKLIDVSQKFSDRKSLSTELWQEIGYD
ncbi:protein FAR1-RELATED SEQUENCE 5-like [Silene latifolia]|uniref:protein FAR1-RELATED SEQUENCE 5-like n=1 Tax=Silene latifolia TaxID=37657 RepID=UPI003D77B586